ncbi:hypothetical protein TNCV_1954011 [Trichonephila clavipes]|nr:hypothetical protein TNCV_1954011 [Trichonephila clavipes]
MYAKFVEAQTLHDSVVWKFGMLDQVSSSPMTEVQSCIHTKAVSVKRLANQRLHLARDEVSDWLDAQRSQVSEMAQAKVLNEQFLEKAREFITRCKTELDWEDLSADMVMDIGCGKDFSCTKALLEKFPQMGCLLAIDTVPVMTNEIMEDEFFTEYFRNATLQFHLLDIGGRTNKEAFARNFLNGKRLDY